MINQYFTIKPQRVRQHELECSWVRTEDPILQEEADHIFRQHVFSFMRQKNQRRLLYEFLDYQYEKTNVEKRLFINHVESVTRANESFFLPNVELAGFVYDWVELKIKGLNSNEIKGSSSKVEDRRNSNNNHKPQKVDKPLDLIVKDKVTFERWLQKLKLKGFITHDNVWVGEGSAAKTQLVGFMSILIDDRIVIKTSRSELGRIVSKYFQIEMNPRNFTTVVKADIIANLRNELK